MDRNLSRRKLLTSCALGAFLPCIAVRSALAETSDLADFLQLSAALTGRSHLSVDSARIYLQSLGPSRGEFRFDLGQLEQDPTNRLARRIVADWYSGQAVDSGRMICVDYMGALMWDAIGFARPRGVPGDDAPHWAFAPATK
ncbi:MAG: sugar dehydrogenase complex small subunit [Methylocystis sp.]|uniref:sugar dehydrogenase complex small subunit n=1 Tax=Methylocystis sp. TaxID=1911079 RepID=UPI003D0C2F5D